MNPFLDSMHWASGRYDGAAMLATISAYVTAGFISEWLQVAVMLLTVIFLSLGIWLRVRAIKEKSEV